MAPALLEHAVEHMRETFNQRETNIYHISIQQSSERKEQGSNREKEDPNLDVK